MGDGGYHCTTHKGCRSVKEGHFPKVDCKDQCFIAPRTKDGAKTVLEDVVEDADVSELSKIEVTNDNARSRSFASMYPALAFGLFVFSAVLFAIRYAKKSPRGNRDGAQLIA